MSARTPAEIVPLNEDDTQPGALPLIDAELVVDKYRTGWGEPDFRVPGSHIKAVDTEERAGKPTDTGTLTLDNTDWRYTSGPESKQLHVGDRIVFRIRTDHSPRSKRNAIGAGAFDSLAFGAAPPQEMARVATYEVLDEQIIEQPGGGHNIVLDVADFVFTRLSNTVAFMSADNQHISGNDNALIDMLLQDKTPSVDRTALRDIDTTVTLMSQGRAVSSLIDRVARRAEDEIGPIVLASEGTSLRFDPIDSLNPVYDRPLPRHTVGLWASESDSHDMTNRVYVSGGFEEENNIADAQETVDTYRTATDTDRVLHRVGSRKSDVSKVEVWTRGGNVVEQDRSVRVRLQEHDEQTGGPVEPSNTNADLAGRSLRVALDPDGFTTFNLQENDIPERRPWLIIDSSGSTGHDIGGTTVQNDDGSTSFIPAYRVHFPKPLLLERPAVTALADYPPYERHVQAETLTSATAVGERAKAELTRSTPGRRVGPLRALAPAAHALRAGDIVNLARPALRATGRFVVTKRDLTYRGPTITTMLEFENMDS
jgi:hypothetical protein